MCSPVADATRNCTPAGPWVETHGYNQRSRRDQRKRPPIIGKKDPPHIFYIEPAVRGAPESGLIRCWYYHKNKIVGQPSSLPRVTIFGS